IDNTLAVNGRYSEVRTRAQVELRYLLTRYLSASASVGWLVQSFGSCSGCLKNEAVVNADDSEAVNVADVYDTSRLVGFTQGLSSLRTGLARGSDPRRPATDSTPKPTPRHGWRASASGGYPEATATTPRTSPASAWTSPGSSTCFVATEL